MFWLSGLRGRLWLGGWVGFRVLRLVALVLWVVRLVVRLPGWGLPMFRVGAGFRVLVCSSADVGGVVG